jgi:hypothetical protein
MKESGRVSPPVTGQSPQINSKPWMPTPGRGHRLLGHNEERDEALKPDAAVSSDHPLPRAVLNLLNVVGRERIEPPFSDVHKQWKPAEQANGLYIRAEIGCAVVEMLIDTGATRSFMSRRMHALISGKQRHVSITEGTPPFGRPTLADGTPVDILGTVTFSVKIGRSVLAVIFQVLETLVPPLILGFTDQCRFRMDISTHKHCAEVGPEGQRDRVQGHRDLQPEAVAVAMEDSQCQPGHACALWARVSADIGTVGLFQWEPGVPAAAPAVLCAVQEVHGTPCIPAVLFNGLQEDELQCFPGQVVGMFEPLDAWRQQLLTIFEEDKLEATAAEKTSALRQPVLSKEQLRAKVEETPDLTPRQKDQVLEHLMVFLSDFAEEPTDLGSTDLVVHSIDTQGARPVHVPARRTPPARAQAERELFQAIQASGKIRPSTSPWSSPVVIVPKRGGGWRFAIDYRAVNHVTKKDVYPLPRIDDDMAVLGGARWFSTLDLASGYWQVRMDEASAEKTAFALGG